MVEGQPVLGYYSGTNKLSFKKGSQLLELYPLHQNTCTDCITSSWYIEQSSLNPTFTYSPVITINQCCTWVSVISPYSHHSSTIMTTSLSGMDELENITSAIELPVKL